MLPSYVAQLGEFVADVTALEAAGADSIWLEAGPEPTAELMIQVGAILAVTHRVGIGLIGSTRQAPTVMETIQRLGGGRGLAALRSGSDLLVADELWAEVELGKDRAAWRQAVEAVASAGRSGLIVAWDPRIIDLLRNAEAEDDRSDLLISTG